MMALAIMGASALAGPQAVRGTDGTRWRLNDDDDPTVVEKVSLEGKPDTTFGRNGRAPLEFGNEASAEALRVDTAGRIWVAATISGNGVSSPMVMRLQPNGQPDASWGAGGRSIAGPTGQRLLVVDLMPLADGLALVAGNLIGSQGENDTGVWRIKADGALDYSFGVGGLWKRPGPEHSHVLSLAAGPNGATAIALEVIGNDPPHREVWLLPAGAREPRLEPADMAIGEVGNDEPYLIWGGSRWLWRRGEQTADLSGLPIAVLRPMLPASVPSEAGNIALNPFAERLPAASAPEAAPQNPSDDLPWGWLGGGLVAFGLLAYVWWRGRRR